MAKTQQTLCRNPTVGDNAHQSRHKDGDNALHGVKGADVSTHANVAKVDAHTCEIGSPHGKLHEIHQC